MRSGAEGESLADHLVLPLDAVAARAALLGEQLIADGGRTRRGLRPAAPACAPSQARKSSGVWAIDLQAHVGVRRAAELGALARVDPGLVSFDVPVRIRPGTTSRLPFSLGAQNEWITSVERRMTLTGTRPGCAARWRW